MSKQFCCRAAPCRDVCYMIFAWHVAFEHSVFSLNVERVHRACPAVWVADRDCRLPCSAHGFSSENMCFFQQFHCLSEHVWNRLNFPAVPPPRVHAHHGVGENAVEQPKIKGNQKAAEECTKHRRQKVAKKDEKAAGGQPKGSQKGSRR